MEKVSFKIVSAEEDYKALLKYNMFQKQKKIPLILGIGTAIAALSLLGSWLHIFPIPLILYYISFAWLILMAIFLISIRGQMKNTSKAAQALVGRMMEFEIGEDGILERDAETEAEIQLPWNHIHEVVQTKKFFFIYVTHNQCFIISKEQIGQENCEALEKILAFYGPKSDK